MMLHRSVLTYRLRVCIKAGGGGGRHPAQRHPAAPVDQFEIRIAEGEGQREYIEQGNFVLVSRQEEVIKAQLFHL